jgi:ketosteroid isomerase-like protein
VVRRIYEAFITRDFPEVLALLAPEIAWWDRDDEPDATAYRGLDEVGVRLRKMSDEWTELRVEPKEFIDAESS